MPRQARLDAPGTLPHVMARGIDRTDIFRNSEDQHKKTLKSAHKKPKFSEITKRIEKELGVSEESLRSATKAPVIVKARKLFCRIAVGRLSYSGAGAARYLNITTSAANRPAVSESEAGTEKIIKLF